nr:hypothetical protein [Nostoc sp. ChiQUE02]MDZ8231272.1 hypothetical protein [Nostoc sp. ChiQUE02]
MYNNKSSVSVTLNDTLRAVQTVEKIIESEAHSINPSAFQEVKKCLKIAQENLKNSISRTEKEQSMPAPHKNEDDKRYSH